MTALREEVVSVGFNSACMGESPGKLWKHTDARDSTLAPLNLCRRPVVSAIAKPCSNTPPPPPGN